MNKNMTSKEKIKLFLSNMIIYGFGNVVTKIIPFIMLPIITRMMPATSYLGISDMASTIISFGCGIATMGIYDAMFRLFFDKDDEEYKKSLCSTALFFVVFNSLIIVFIMWVIHDYLTQFLFQDNQYVVLVYMCGLSVFISAQGSIEAAPTRMQNKRRVFLITNFLSALFAYLFTIILLHFKHYAIAMTCGTLLSGLIINMVFIFLNRSFFSVKFIKISLLKDLLKIGIPVMPSILIYWVFHSCDRLMITSILGLEPLGVYSAAAKIGQASQIVYTAFAEGWQYYAFYTMKERQQVKSNSGIFECLGIISLTVSLGVFSFIKPLFKILLASDYLSGYIAAPFLFLGPLLLMLYQIVGNQFMIAKRTLPSLIILSIGAGVNIALNYILIPLYGIEGAAVATVLGYFSSLIIMCVFAWKNKLFFIKVKFVISVFLFMIYVVMWKMFYCDNTTTSVICALVVVLIYIILYRKDIRILALKLRSK